MKDKIQSQQYQQHLIIHDYMTEMVLVQFVFKMNSTYWSSKQKEMVVQMRIYIKGPYNSHWMLHV